MVTERNIFPLNNEDLGEAGICYVVGSFQDSGDTAVNTGDTAVNNIGKFPRTFRVYNIVFWLLKNSISFYKNCWFTFFTELSVGDIVISLWGLYVEGGNLFLKMSFIIVCLLILVTLCCLFIYVFFFFFIFVL